MNFLVPGKASMVIDGQFGSSGKGLIASYFAENCRPDISVGCLEPNAGHSFYMGNTKFVTHLIPVSAIWNPTSLIYLSADSVIDIALLEKEISEFNIDRARIVIHPRAAVTLPSAQYDPFLVSIGSTQKGTGPARASKLLRKNPLALNTPELEEFIDHDFKLKTYLDNGATAFVETGQGLGLGINHGFSYPYCTSRDVLPSVILGELALPPRMLGYVCMAFRIFPIRVSNPANGTSGPFYPDSHECSWEDINVPVEVTTVSKKTRRVATWSNQQLQDALEMLEPDIVFLNFCNYLDVPGQKVNCPALADILSQVPGREVLLGYGAKNCDVMKSF